MQAFIFTVVMIFGVVNGEQLCTPDGSGVRRLNGRPCASTTRYSDGRKGACGCGFFNTAETSFDWNLNMMTVGASQKYFDDGGDRTWCGSNCGMCVKLTPTGGFVPLRGRAPPNNNPQIFLVTNDCPIHGNEEWCGQQGKPGTGNHNSFGYEVPFDLQNHNNQVSNTLNWDNVETVREKVDCPSYLVDNYKQCQCYQ